MARVIAIANQKGGVGKTTTTVNLGIAIAREGYKVLAIDLDPQSNLTTAMGVRTDDPIYNIADIFERILNDQELDPFEGIRRHDEGLDYMPSCDDLAAYESLISAEMGREAFLKEYVDQLRPHYDYILIDCPRNMGILPINAMVACDSVLIPTQGSIYSLKGLENMFKTVSKIRRKLNKEIDIEGVLISMIDRRNNYPKQVLQEIRNAYGDKIRVFDTEIPLSTRADETAAYGISIFEHDPKGKAAAAYMQLMKEVVNDAPAHEFKRSNTRQTVR